MRASIVTALLFFGFTPVFGAQAQDTVELRVEAAKRYAAVANMPKMLSDSFEAMSKNLPENERAKFLDLTRKFVNPATLEKLSIDTMVKHFTSQELDALARFYGSPEGQSAMAKFGVYMAEVLPLVQAEMARTIQAIQQEMQQETAK